MDLPSFPRRAAFVAALLPLALLTACGDDTTDSGQAGSSDRPLVVATTTQLADFASVVGGEDVEVYSVLRPNMDAHDFEASPQDLDALARADVILSNGLEFEPWLDDATEAAGAEAEVIDTSEGATLLEGAHHEHDEDEAHSDEEEAHDEEDDEGHEHEGEWNPHLWFDPTNAQVMVGHVADAIAAAVPDAEAEVRERAADYDAELEELDTWIAEQIGSLDEPKLVTDHEAFPYYTERYDIEFVGAVIPSFDSSAEVSAADLDELATLIDEAGVRAIFTEQSMSPKAAEALARRTEVEVVSGEDGLYGDSLGPEGSSGATYLTMMQHNTETIVENLS